MRIPPGHGRQIEAAVGCGEQRVNSGHRFQRVLGEDEAHFPAKRLGKGGVGTNRIGKQHPAALDVGPQLLPLGIGQVERVAAVHENQVVVEQGVVGEVDFARLGADADLQLLGRRLQQVDQGPGRHMASARVAEAGHVDPAPREGIVRRLLDHLAGYLVLEFQFPIGGVGQHVDADRQSGVDLRLHHGMVLAVAAGAGQLPEAGERGPGAARCVGIGRAIDDAGTATELDPPERPQMLRVDGLFGVPQRVLRRQQAQPVLPLVKDAFHQLAESPVEIGAGRVSFGNQEATPVEIIAEFPGLLLRLPDHFRLLLGQFLGPFL